MAQRETTFEAWTLPNLAAPFAHKFALTPYINSRTFSIDYNAGGDGSMQLMREFPYFDQFVHVDSLDHTNDIGSLVRVNKDNVPVAHYLARRYEDDIDPKAVLRPVTLQSLNFFLDRAHVAPFDHIPGDDANSPNPTLDPDWEYGAESVLPPLGNEISNEIHEVWRGSTVTMGTFRLSDGVDQTDPMDWDVSSSEMRTRLETDIAAIVDVSVRGDGSLKTPWEIEYVNPAGNVSFLISVTDNTTDGVFSTSITRNGGTLDPTPWHKSYNPVTKTEHGNYQGFEIMHRDDVPAGLQAASSDEYFLRVNLDSVNNSTDYGGAQILPNVEPGSRYRSSVPVWAAFEFGARHVLRQMNEVHIADGGDVTVAASTLTELTIPTFTTGTSTTEIIYRVGILETTDIGDVYIAIMSAVLAPGEPAANFGKIMNDQLVPINARGMLTWVTPTWTDDLDSKGVAWDQPLQWTVSHRQSLLQLVEFARQWGYESSGIYWSVANSRFQWDLFNPGGGGSVLTTPVITTGDIDGTSPITHVSPSLSSAWAFGRNGIWGRYEDPDLIGAFGILESMDLDRQGRENLVTHAMEAVEAAKTSATGQRLRLRTDRFTAFVDVNPGDFVELNLGPRFINGVYRVAGITDVDDEEGNEYQEFHVGTLVKDATTAVTDTVRELYREFKLLGGQETGGAVNPAQTNVPEVAKGRPIIIAASNASDEWKDAADFVCTGTSSDPIDGDTFDEAAASELTGFGNNFFQLSPGEFWFNTDPGHGVVFAADAIFQGCGSQTRLIGVVVTDSAPLIRDVVLCTTTVQVRDLYVTVFGNPTNVTVNGIRIGQECIVERVVGQIGKGWMTVAADCYQATIRDCASYMDGGLFRLTGDGTEINLLDNRCFSAGVADTGLIHIESSLFTAFISGNEMFTDANTGDIIRFDRPSIYEQWDTIHIVNNMLFHNSFSVGAVDSAVIRVRGATDAFDWVIANNEIFSRNGHGLIVEDLNDDGTFFYYGLIVDNLFSTRSWSILFTDGDHDGLNIQGNTFRDISGQVAGCIFFDMGHASASARDLKIDNNLFYAYRADGVVLFDKVFDFSISDNFFHMLTNPASAKDGVRVDGAHGRGTIKGNVFIPPATATNARYAINPAHANGSNLVVVGNDLRGTWGTAAINVTNSPIVDYPSDATFGDNFT